MIVIVNSKKIGMESSFNQPESETLDDLRQSFIEKFGEDVYTRASKVIIVEENFFNIIKDRYGPVQIGEHNDFLSEVINQHLEV
jgi:hypothetical protein